MSPQYSAGREEDEEPEIYCEDGSHYLMLQPQTKAPADLFKRLESFGCDAPTPRKARSPRRSADPRPRPRARPRPRPAPRAPRRKKKKKGTIARAGAPRSMLEEAQRQNREEIEAAARARSPRAADTSRSESAAYGEAAARKGDACGSPASHPSRALSGARTNRRSS